MTNEKHRSAAQWSLRAVVFCAVMFFSNYNLNWYSPHLRPYSLGLIGLVGTLALAVAICRWELWQRICTRLEGLLGELHPGATVLLFVWGTLAALGLAYFILDPIPHIPDGYAYVFQAKIFTLGKFYADTPALPDFFPAPWSVNLDGRTFSVFPPGWPIVLSLGVALGQPWLVNPVLAGLCLFAMWHLWRELFDVRRANFALLLCAVSPFFLFMSAGFMSHNASLLASTVFVLGFLKSVRKQSIGWGVVAACAIAFHILVRPVSAAFVWGPTVLFFALFQRSRASWIATALSIVGSGFGSALYGIYNRILTGEWGVPPLYFLAPANRYGFGADIGLPWASSFPTPGHDLFRAAQNLNFNMTVMNSDLFGWPLASLSFVLVCLLFGRLAWQHKFCAAVVAAFVVSYAGYWYNGVAFGARFYYCLLPYLAILTVEGIRTTPRLLLELVPRMDERSARTLVTTVVLGFVFYGATIYIPKVGLTGPYWNQRKISYELYEELHKQVQPGDLVLVEADSDERYNPLFIHNEIDIETSDVVFAWDQGDQNNQRLLAHFEGRRVVRWRYPIERLKEETPMARLRGPAH
ncbi:MAG: hypothetical protein ACI9QQ_001094 [Myxococcota bacterium]|jgi:hypothetical protein